MDGFFATVAEILRTLKPNCLGLCGDLTWKYADLTAAALNWLRVGNSEPRFLVAAFSLVASAKPLRFRCSPGARTWWVGRGGTLELGHLSPCAALAVPGEGASKSDCSEALSTALSSTCLMFTGWQWLHQCSRAPSCHDQLRRKTNRWRSRWNDQRSRYWWRWASQLWR